MVVVLTGSNSHMLSSKLESMVSAFTQEHGDSIERFDGNDITTSDVVLDAVRSISFLEPHKLVIVKNFAQNKELLGRIEDVVEQIADTTELILVDQKVDKRSTSYKYLQKNTEVTDCKDMDAYGLANWAAEYASSIGTSLTRRDAQFLIDRVGINQQLVVSEIHKLALYNSKEISKEAIEMLTEPTPQSKIFSLLEALFQGKSEKAWSYYQDQQEQGVEPQQIIAMLTWQLQQLAMAVHAPGHSVDALVGAGISPYSAKKALGLAKNTSQQDLLYYVQTLSSIDQLIKTSADPTSALEAFLSAVIERQQ